jgi:hypothetical protein
VKNFANDFRSISSFVYAYQDRFRLARDDDAVANHVQSGGRPRPAGTLNNAASTVPGTSQTTDESYLFWQHAVACGLSRAHQSLAMQSTSPQRDGGRVGITGAITR